MTKEKTVDYQRKYTGDQITDKVKRDVIESARTGFLESLEKVDPDNFSILALIKTRKEIDGEIIYGTTIVGGGDVAYMGEMILNVIESRDSIGRAFHKAMQKKQFMEAIKNEDPDEIGKIIASMITSSKRKESEDEYSK